jgi:vacuolar-type H+-ATPase subunit I/STV1
LLHCGSLASSRNKWEFKLLPLIEKIEESKGEQEEETGGDDEEKIKEKKQSLEEEKVEEGAEGWKEINLGRIKKRHVETVERVRVREGKISGQKKRENDSSPRRENLRKEEDMRRNQVREEGRIEKIRGE